MKTLKNIDISGKRVLIRVDFNVPMDENQNITDDARIKAVVPTLIYAIEQKAKIIVASHMGRPKGKVVKELSLAPVAKRLGELLEKDVKMAPDCIGDAAAALVSTLSEGEVLLLENLRFHPEEGENDDAFGEKLAGLCDIYINDAFAVSHRENASVCAVTKYAPVSAAGFLLEKELAFFEKAMSNPERPFVAIIGGAKVSSKLGVLENLLSSVDKIIIGGAMANTFLKGCGIDVGQSKVENDLIAAAASTMKQAEEKGIDFLLPVDVVVAGTFDADAETKIVGVDDIPKEWMVLDIGPETIKLFAQAVSDAKTIVWNGPMGVFEMDAFSNGTVGLAQHVADSKALTVVGGGDTDAAIHLAGVTDRISYISTGGGAFLELLEGKVLPAVHALVRENK
ncbi:MAG: phosphoglycerate kinase [Desulfobacterales bacterium]|nr:phosphoglycerate kinase [Desulfobacterales bacterium]